MKVAIVGRRNTGKSTLINTLAESERMIVSEVPGTTRDSVDVRFEMDGKSFIAIDTPGFRRRKSVDDRRRLLRHATAPSGAFAGPTWCSCSSTPRQRISKVDKQLCDYIAEQYKPCIFVVNKWDLLADSMPTERWVTLSSRHVSGDVARSDRVCHRPDRQERQDAAEPRPDALQAVAQPRGHARDQPPGARPRWSTTRRRCFATAGPRSTTPPRSPSQPPTIILFCNNPQALSRTYRRYLLGVFRDQLPFSEVPIKLYLRKRESGDTRDDIESKGGEDVSPFAPRKCVQGTLPRSERRQYGRKARSREGVDRKMDIPFSPRSPSSARASPDSPRRTGWSSWGTAADSCCWNAPRGSAACSRRSTSSGFQVEQSADNFITTVPYGLDLCRRLGLSDQLIQTDPRYRQTYVVHRGRLHKLPDGFLMMAPTRMWPLALTPILSPWGKLRAGLEYFIPPSTSEADESMASFVRRRLGREAFDRLVEPLVSAVYAADMERLSVDATLSRFRDMEREHGSLVRAMRFEMAARRRAKQKAETQSGARYSMFVTLRDGLQSLVDALASRLPDGLRPARFARDAHPPRERRPMVAGDSAIAPRRSTA